MTRNKDAAYCAAVERAFRDDKDGTKIDSYKAVTYSATDPVYQRCCADVLAALNALPEEEKIDGKMEPATVDLDTFAFMLGIGPSALSKQEDKNKPAPHVYVDREVASLGGKVRISSKPYWTLRQVKDYRSIREERDENKKNKQSSTALARRNKRKEARAIAKDLQEQLHGALERLRDSESSFEMKNFADIAVKALVNANRLLLGFVDLHNLSRDELRDAFRAGARIECMTLRHALTKRTWASPSALQPWVREYGRVIEAYVVRERDLVAAAVARSETNELEELPKAKTTPSRQGSRM